MGAWGDSDEDISIDESEIVDEIHSDKEKQLNIKEEQIGLK